MNTGEFSSRLEDALRGKVSNQVIEANLQYYRDYITGEIRKGRTEEQVMDDLGDPRLIARTIIETQGGSGAGAGSGSSSASGYSYSQQAERSSYPKREESAPDPALEGISDSNFDYRSYIRNHWDGLQPCVPYSSFAGLLGAGYDWLCCSDLPGTKVRMIA